MFVSELVGIGFTSHVSLCDIMIFFDESVFRTDIILLSLYWSAPRGGRAYSFLRK